MPRRTLRDALTGWFAPRESAGMAHAGTVLAHHAERLMRTSGVMSVGVGTDAAGDPAIIVGVSGHQAAEVGLPESIDGVPVLVQEVGRTEAF
ncbi:MAG: hypothetical protein JW733_03895 [Coriobacteriia bacterium]|nr:hypothetical protein [Coriobacteriia bacterium]MBN2839698.1 hypothetical protein [Coriobacteriia bacterium]